MKGKHIDAENAAIRRARDILGPPPPTDDGTGVREPIGKG